MSRPLIKGQVARILDSRNLVLNRGSEDGVVEGMVFAVLDRTGEHITDPETGKELGSVYRPKVRVRVVNLQPNLTVARTFRKTTVNVGGSGVDVGLSRIFLPPKLVNKYETLKSDDAAWEELDESQSFVKIGDPVEEVPPDQVEDDG